MKSLQISSMSEGFYWTPANAGSLKPYTLGDAEIFSLGVELENNSAKAKCAALQVPASSLESSVRQIGLLATYPAWASGFATVFERRLCKLYLNLFGEIRDPVDTQETANVKREWKERQSDPLTADEQFKIPINGKTMISSNIRVYEHAYDSFMALTRAIVIESWTAFETFAKDSYQVAAKVTSVPKARFTTFDKIRNGYKNGFPSLWSQVAPVLDPIEPHAKLRNVLVHNAGRADEEFLKSAIDVEWKGLQIGQHVPIPAAKVAPLVRQSVKAAVKLLGIMDDFLYPLEPNNGQQPT